MSKKITGILSVVVLAVYVFVAALSVEGSVLCFGSDGHVAIEYVDSCKRSGGELQLAETEDDACGPCTDVQFFSSPACTKTVVHFGHDLLPISSSAALLSVPLKEYFKKQKDLSDYSLHKTLASLHSVILLI